MSRRKESLPKFSDSENQNSGHDQSPRNSEQDNQPISGGSNTESDKRGRDDDNVNAIINKSGNSES